MVIRNNRRSLITLEYKKSGNRTLVSISAGSEVNVLSLIDSSDIINKEFFSNGWLSIVSKEENKEKEITEKKETVKDKKKKNHQLTNKTKEK